MAARIAAVSNASVPGPAAVQTDWQRVAALLHASRALDDIEETRLLPERKVLYQFSARGHDLAQILLGLQLTDPHDGASGLLPLAAADARAGRRVWRMPAAGPLARAGSFSGGRDIGVVFNLPGRGGPACCRPVGGVGAQYTPAAGWAQAIRYRARDAAATPAYARSIAVVLGGDASTATNGFWSALNIATTLQLPMLFYIEDNALRHLRARRTCRPRAATSRRISPSFSGLTILEGDGADPRRPRRADARRRSRACATQRSAACCCASRCRACRATRGRTRRPTNRPTDR